MWEFIYSYLDTIRGTYLSSSYFILHTTFLLCLKWPEPHLPEKILSWVWLPARDSNLLLLDGQHKRFLSASLSSIKFLLKLGEGVPSNIGFATCWCFIWHGQQHYIWPRAHCGDKTWHGTFASNQDRNTKPCQQLKEFASASNQCTDPAKCFLTSAFKWKLVHPTWPLAT